MELIERMYSEGRAVGKTGKVFESVPVSTKNNLNTIKQLMEANTPAATLEIGLAFGGSALIFADMHRRSFPLPSRRHVAIDPYQSTVWDSVGMMKLEEAHLAEFVEVIEQPSSLALPRLLDQGRQFGLIYVDGSHLFEDVFVDGFYGARLLAQDGYLLFDDLAQPQIAKVIRFIDKNLPGLSRQPERTLRHRVARILGRRQLAIYRKIGPIERPWNTPFVRF
jgi:predicted O-methyltransferase YrrM